MALLSVPWQLACTITARIAAYLTASQAEVVPFYRLEKSGAFALHSPERSPGSAQTGKPTPEGEAFTVDQIARGAAELRDMIVDALKSSDGHITAAAAQLGITPRMVRYKIKKLRIDIQQFAQPRRHGFDHRRRIDGALRLGDHLGADVGAQD